MTSAYSLDKDMNLASPDYLSTTPFLMDGLVLRWRVFGSAPGIRNPTLPTRRFVGSEEHRHAFAHPHVYPISKGISQYLKPFGKHSARTNGRRILRHVSGDPLPHFSGNETTINKAEKAKKNKMSIEEIRLVKKLANDSGVSPANFLALESFKIIEDSREKLIDSHGLRNFNAYEDVLSHVSVERLEVYFETLCVGPDMNFVALTLEKVLRLFLGLSKKTKGNLIQCFNNDDLEAYAAWELPQKNVSKELKGKRPFVFKVYKDRDRLRIELQANFPKFVKPTQFDGTCSPYECIAQDMIRLTNILEDTLSLIWSITSDDVKTGDFPIYQEEVRRRLEVLLPAKSKHASVENVIRQIGIEGYLTFKLLESFGWSRNDLKQMANKDFGFLRKRSKGFSQRAEADAPPGKRIVGAIFVLVPEWLGRTGKPPAKSANGISPSVPVSATPRTDAIGVLLNQASGSSLMLLSSSLAASAISIVAAPTVVKFGSL